MRAQIERLAVIAVVVSVVAAFAASIAQGTSAGRHLPEDLPNALFAHAVVLLVFICLPLWSIDRATDPVELVRRNGAALDLSPVRFVSADLPSPLPHGLLSHRYRYALKDRWTSVLSWPYSRTTVEMDTIAFWCAPAESQVNLEKFGLRVRRGRVERCADWPPGNRSFFGGPIDDSLPSLVDVSLRKWLASLRSGHFHAGMRWVLYLDEPGDAASDMAIAVERARGFEAHLPGHVRWRSPT